LTPSKHTRVEQIGRIRAGAAGRPERFGGSEPPNPERPGAASHRGRLARHPTSLTQFVPDAPRRLVIPVTDVKTPEMIRTEHAQWFPVMSRFVIPTPAPVTIPISIHPSDFKTYVSIKAFLL